MAETKTKARRMRELLESGRLVVSPGIYDGYSARLVEKAGFLACSTTGAGVANSRLGQPDIGIMSLMENVAACRDIAMSVSIPVMADADTGYGNPVTVFHAVQYFENAGVVGINIEDQVNPKRCGHMRGKELVSPLDAAKKIEAAVKAKKDPDFIINARTDALAVEGLEGTIKRCKMYVEAGADMVYPDAIRTVDEIKAVVDAVGAPVSINMGFGIRTRPTTPLLSVKQLEDLGVARASFARMLPAAAIGGMMKAIDVFKETLRTGMPADRPDLLASIEDITDLMGYSFINNLEGQFLSDDEIQRRYKDGSRDIVVQGGH